MRIPRIYQDHNLSIAAQFTLSDGAARHVSQVLRLGTNDKLILFNGDGHEYPAVIQNIQKNRVEVKIANVVTRDVESPLKIHLGQAISKGERMDLTLQKATELGVSEITPLFSTRSEVRLKGDREQKKMTHWQKVIVSSAEQCGRNRLPELYGPTDIHEWIRDCEKKIKNANSIKIVLDHRSEVGFKEGISSHKLHEKIEKVFLLVGPEGGLTTEEKDYAETQQFLRLSLGPRILRTETAGIVAITALQVLFGDL